MLRRVDTVHVGIGIHVSLNELRGAKSRMIAHDPKTTCSGVNLDG